MANIFNGIVRWRIAVAAVWIVAAVVLATLIKPPDPALTERKTFLPDWAPSVQATDLLVKYFPQSSGLSNVVVIIERGPAADLAVASAPTTRPLGTLTDADMAYLRELMQRLRAPLPDELAKDLRAERLSVHGPSDLGLLPGNPFISPDSLAALAVVEAPANYVTVRSARTVAHVRRVVSQTPPPPGLQVWITGSAAMGADYAAAAETSNHRTIWVTVVAVILILMVVYRAPLAAAVVIGTISLVAVVANGMLHLAANLGLHVGTAEKIFIFVLLYGAGVDYSLLYLARFREMLGDCRPPIQAAGDALRAIAPTIIASAGTVIAGLAVLSAAQFRVFKTTGQSVALALTLALLGALTLLPAAAALLHRRLFWPSRDHSILGATKLWPAVADLVTRRPVAVLAVTLLALAWPAWQATRLNYSYDSAAGLSGNYGSVAGLQAVKRHWPVGEIAPTTILLSTDQPDEQKLRDAAARLTADLMKIDGVANVRSISQPLGRPRVPGLSSPLSFLFQGRIDAQYLSPDRRATRLTVLLDEPPFSNKALAVLETIRQRARQADPEGIVVSIAGATAETTDIRTVTQQDFRRVAVLTLTVVLLIVLALLRDWVLSIFMVLTTVASYLATLGLTSWFFNYCCGTPLDWKVEVFLFVVMVAVGQDYNIFLAARLAEESRTRTPAEAARLAVVRTGGIISSAGMIMAATLGSLVVGDLSLLVQLGFAFALGMLLDTFIVRPLLLPAFATLTGRTGKPFSRRLGQSGPERPS